MRTSKGGRRVHCVWLLPWQPGGLGDGPRAFDDYCRNEGIVRHHTIPHTQRQNDVAEPMSKTIISKAHCMLSNARMSKHLWAEAANIACYLINKTPSIPLNNKLPLRYGEVHLQIIHS